MTGLECRNQLPDDSGGPIFCINCWLDERDSVGTHLWFHCLISCSYTISQRHFNCFSELQIPSSSSVNKTIGNQKVPLGR